MFLYNNSLESYLQSRLLVLHLKNLLFDYKIMVKENEKITYEWWKELNSSVTNIAKTVEKESELEQSEEQKQPEVAAKEYKKLLVICLSLSMKMNLI